MQFEEKLDVIEEDIAQYSRELLDILLKDRTTNKNIIWATNDYSSYGALYQATEQIDANLITGIYSKIIQPRVAKNELKNRGVKEILILCADGLSGIKEAIAAAYPKST